MLRLAYAVSILLVSMVPAGADWPRFRGPDGSGVAGPLDLPAAITAGHVRWDVKLPGSGHSSPVVFKDLLVLTCEDLPAGRRAVVGFDAGSGALRWTTWMPFERYRVHPDNSLAAASAAIDAEAVYLSWVTDGRVEALALDHAGKELWRRQLGAFEATHGPGGSLIVVDDVVVVANDQEAGGAAIYGLDRKSGRTVWSVERSSGRPSYATPAVYQDQSGGKRIVISSPAHGFTCLDPRDGKPQWSLGGVFSLNVVASPVVVDGFALACAGRGGSREAAVVRFTADGTATLAYRPADDVPYVPTPVVVGGDAYLWDDRGMVTCMELRTGKVRWAERLTGPTYTSPVSDGKRIIGISRKGELVSFPAGPTVPEATRFQLPEGTHATPAIAHRSLFVRTFSRLLRIGS